MKKERLFVALSLLILLWKDTSAQTLESRTSDKYMGTVKVRLEPRTVPDTIQFYVWGEFGNSMQAFTPEYHQTQIAKDGVFNFHIPDMGRPVYISMYVSGQQVNKSETWPNLGNLLVNPGDSLCFKYARSEKKVDVSGRGSVKVNAWLKTYEGAVSYRKSLPTGSLSNDPENYFENARLALKFMLSELETFQHKMDSDSYGLLRADAKGLVYGSLYRYLGASKFATNITKDSTVMGKARQIYEASWRNLEADTTSETVLLKSAYYCKYINDKAFAEITYLKLLDSNSRMSYLDIFQRDYAKGLLLDKLVTTYLVRKNATGLSKTLMDDGLFIVGSQRYQSVLKRISKQIATGSAIQDFNFETIDGKSLTLEDVKGKTVVMDMWFSGCTNCVGVAKGLKEIEHKLNDRNIVFVSLSVDKEKPRWLRSINPEKNVIDAQHNYTHYTTPDTRYVWTGGNGSDHGFIRRYNPTNTYSRLIIIDRDGKMLKSDPPIPIDAERIEAFYQLLNGENIL